MLAMAIPNLGIAVEHVDHVRFSLKKRGGRCEVIIGFGLDGPHPINNEIKNISLEGGSAVEEVREGKTQKLKGRDPVCQKELLMKLKCFHREVSYKEGDHPIHRCYLTIERVLEKELE